jgi:hypothetical protein
LFWRWPEEWQEEARDGIKIHHYYQPTPKPKAPKIPMTGEILAMMLIKLSRFINRRYFEARKWITIAILFFGVKKGDNDMRPLWSCTSNGVNPSVFSPKFFLPTGNSLCRKMYNGAFSADFDVGEMFHNFCLHPAE